MNIDLPEDSAVAVNEVVCLKRFDEALAQLRVEKCITCHEAGFDMALVDNVCRRCRTDKTGPAKKFSQENNVTPCKL